MKKLIVHGIGAVGAAAAAVAMFGTGIAAADDYAGQTYADASSAASDAGQTVVVANRVGDKLPQDECIVTRSWDAPFVRDVEGSFGHASDEVELSLNCNGGYATAAKPGNSLASPEGREAKAAADQAAAEEQQTLEEVSTPNE
jgi:hypothetical protein